MYIQVKNHVKDHYLTSYKVLYDKKGHIINIIRPITTMKWWWWGCL